MDPRLRACWRFDPGLQRALKQRVEGKLCRACLPEHHTTGNSVDTNDTGSLSGYVALSLLDSSGAVVQFDRLVSHVVTGADGSRTAYASHTTGATWLAPTGGNDRQHLWLRAGDRAPEPATEEQVALLKHLYAVAPQLQEANRFIILRNPQAENALAVINMHVDARHHIPLVDVDLVTGRRGHYFVPAGAVEAHQAAAVITDTSIGPIAVRDLDNQATPAELTAWGHVLAAHAQQGEGSAAQGEEETDA